MTIANCAGCDGVGKHLETQALCHWCGGLGRVVLSEADQAALDRAEEAEVLAEMERVNRPPHRKPEQLSFPGPRRKGDA